MRQALKKLGLAGNGGGSSRKIKRIIQENGFDISHWHYPKNKAANLKNKKPLTEILAEKSKYTNTHCLKRRLVKEGILDYICSNCGISSWQGKPISLHLDHINGINNDHRLENLRILCPNCHSQTPTYAGKKLKRNRCCIECNVQITKGATKCRKCNLSQERVKKITWPEMSKLIEMIKESNWSAVARKLNVSDNAVRKHVRKYK